MKHIGLTVTYVTFLFRTHKNHLKAVDHLRCGPKFNSDYHCTPFNEKQLYVCNAVNRYLYLTSQNVMSGDVTLDIGENELVMVII